MEKKKRFNGKALYQPKGKAEEYSPWAVNFYTGCSNDCAYCYCKRGVMSHVWSTTPTLKKCFKDGEHALLVYLRELMQNLDEVRKTGILFSFTTDPMLPETKELTMRATETALHYDVPVKILTKRADWFYEDKWKDILKTKFWREHSHLLAWGFTLTGNDIVEPNADLNGDRVSCMIRLKYLGFKTWASIEPVIEVENAMKVIDATVGFCNLYKVGLISGMKKDFYKPGEIDEMVTQLATYSHYGNNIYLKNSVLEYLGITSEQANNEYDGKFVGADFNIFTCHDSFTS